MYFPDTKMSGVNKNWTIRKGYSKGFYGAMSVNEKIDSYFNYIKENREITDLYYHSYFLKNNVGKIPYEKIIQDFESIIENPMINGETIRIDGALRMQP